jgi:hypothetical protein
MTSVLDGIEMAFTHVTNHNQLTRKCSLCSLALQHKLALRKEFLMDVLHNRGDQTVCLLSSDLLPVEVLGC